MAELIKADLIISVLVLLVFRLARDWLTSEIPPATQKLWRNALLVITSLAFLSPSIWIFFALAWLQLVMLSSREPNRAVIYALMLCTVPPVMAVVPGFGVINNLMLIDYQRLLALVMLLPAISRPSSLDKDPAATRTDQLLLGFVILCSILNFRGTTLTDGMRESVYVLLDSFLPYWVINRAIQNLTDIRRILTALTVTALVLAAAGSFEFLKHWLLYFSIGPHWGIIDRDHPYLLREGSVRATATLASPIALGFLMVVALGFWFYLAQTRAQRTNSRAVPGLLGLGLLFPLSRGPWIGAVVLYLVYQFTAPGGLKRAAKLLMLALILFPLLYVIPGGDKVINLLPFIGHTEEANVTYRQNLMTNAWIVIQRNFLLGSMTFLSTPEMQSMVQGQGIIDIVNTYLGIALKYGMLGLAFFAGFLISVLHNLIQIARLTAHRPDLEILRRILLASMLSIMIMIITVSPVGMIGQLYMMIAAVAIGFARLVRTYSSQTDHPNMQA